MLVPYHLAFTGYRPTNSARALKAAGVKYIFVKNTIQTNAKKR